jgi:hypothetical protein
MAAMAAMAAGAWQGDGLAAAFEAGGRGRRV